MESRLQQREPQKAVIDQPNLTGIPTQMKLNFEQRSGMSFDDVRVHYNSDKPAQFHALAYTQGAQVYIGPGQERHLPHELGHVVQQKLGIVRANAMHPSGAAMNTEEALERQADEIGAGRRIEVPPANSASTDIVQRYISVGNCIFAQAPGPDGKRKVMVKDGEPASVYFEESVLNNESESIKPLRRLGIVKTEEGKVYTDSSGGDIGTFFRFGQGWIPDISSAYGQKRVEEQILQPARTEDDLRRAEQLLGVQAVAASELWSLAQKLLEYITGVNSDETIPTQTLDKTTKIVNAYHNLEEPDNFIAMHLLGGDITLDMFTLRSIAKQLSSGSQVDNAPITEKDIKLALEIVKEDLEFRVKQVMEELNPEVLAFVPQIPTGCDTSAERREILSSLKYIVANFKAGNFGKHPDGGSLIHWRYHYATPVPLSGIIGADDCLFIEDAVGKSSSGDECANAHWVAHIYGRREEQNSSPQTSEVETNNETEDGFKKLDCRFNDLSEELRSKFLEDIKIDDNSVYKLTYPEGVANVKLKIVVRKNMMMYKFSSIPSKQYMKHFMMDVAKTVLDEFVLQAFVLKDKDIREGLNLITYKFINLKSNPNSMAPKPSDYTIERVQLKKEK